MGGQKVAFVLCQFRARIRQYIDNPLSAEAHFMQVKVLQGSCVRFTIENQGPILSVRGWPRFETSSELGTARCELRHASGQGSMIPRSRDRCPVEAPRIGTQNPRPQPDSALTGAAAVGAGWAAGARF